MKKPVFVVLSILFSAYLFGQNKQEIQLRKYNILYSANYTITATVSGLDNFQYTLSDLATGKDTSFVLYPNSFDAFRENFEGAFLGLSSAEAKAKYQQDTARLKDEASKLYYMFISDYYAGFYTEDKPLAGELCFDRNGITIYRTVYSKDYLKREAKVYWKDHRKNCCPKGSTPTAEVCKKERGRKVYRIDTSDANTWYSKKEFKKEYVDYIRNKRSDELTKEAISKDSIYREELSNKKMKSDSLAGFSAKKKVSSLKRVDLNNQVETINLEIDKKRGDVLYNYTESFTEPTLAGAKDIILTTEGDTNDLNALKRLIRQNREIYEDQMNTYQGRFSSMEEKLQDSIYIVQSLSPGTPISEAKITERRNELERDSLILYQLMVSNYSDSIERVNRSQQMTEDKLHEIRLLAKAKDSITKAIGQIDIEIKNIEKNVIEVNKKIQKADSVISLRKAELIAAVSKIDRFSFRVIDIEVEFNEGFIENIRVIGNAKLAGDYELEKEILKALSLDSLKFGNPYPFGFSSKNDYEYLLELKLFAKDNQRDNYVMNASDLLNEYFQKHEVNRRDYSPADGVVTFNESQGFCQELKKDETYKLLEAKIFSDFVGFEATSPNGLVQTEVSREFRLYTKRFRINTRNNEMDAWNIGFLSYVEPRIVLSKIEDNNKSLNLFYAEPVSDGTGARRYASAIGMREHEYLSINPVEQNLIFLDIPGFKSTFYLNAGLKFGRTSIADTAMVISDTNSAVTESISYGINTFSWYARLIWEVKTDERLGLYFSYSPEYFDALTEQFTQVNNYTDLLTEPGKAKWLHGLEFNAFLNPNKNKSGRLFFRYRYTWQQGSKMNDGFHQAQVGYSFYLIGRNKDNGQ